MDIVKAGTFVASRLYHVLDLAITSETGVAQPFLSLLATKIAGVGLQTSDEIQLETKHFFSGAALYVNGRICASLTPAGFGLKLPADVRDQLIKDGKGTELRYFEKAPVKKEYVSLSEPVANDPDELRPLLELSIEHVLRRA